MSRLLTYAGVFLVAMSTLMLEVLLTRITSVIAWYHLAFFVISLGMLGMTAGAVLVFTVPALFSPETLARRLTQSALGYGLSVPICVGLAMATPMANVIDLMTFLGLLGSGAILAVPFILGGVTLTLALTRAGLPPNWVYGVDLCGAACGCVAIIALLSDMDAPSAAIAAGAIGCAGAACFAFADQARQAQSWGRARGRRAALMGALALAALSAVNSAQSHRPFRPAWVKSFLEHPGWFAVCEWNSYSRVTVDHETFTPPAFWAKGSNTPEPLLVPRRQRVIRIDGAAATVMTELGGNPRDHAYLEWDISGFAHRLRPVGAAAVIGVGGGRDVLASLQAGHRPVLGVELNQLIIDLHHGPFRALSGLAEVPGVQLVADEARSYFARTRDRYRVLTMSLIDTWASTGAGAYSLSENGLYTREAWNVFLDRLTDDGVFTVSRWYVANSPGETARILALAMETLFTRGVDKPRRHIIMVQNEQVSTLLLGREPFSAADIDTAQREAGAKGFNMLVTPRRLPAHPMLKALAEIEDRDALWKWTASQALDLTPPTDSRPFFFSMLKPSTWLDDRADVDAMDLPQLGNLQATQTLLYATLVSLLLTLVTIVLPISLRRTSLRPYGRRTTWAACSYFALIGLGFMYVEMGMLSQLNVFLGHPTLALSVLLSGIIFFTGTGSMLSGRLRVDHVHTVRLYPLAPAALVLLAGQAMTPVMGAFAAEDTPVRIVVSVGLLAPPALAMGLCFPMGLRLLERLEAQVRRRLAADGSATSEDIALGPWMWGINGAFGVCASGLALGTSMVWGIGTTLMVGTICYAALPITTTLLDRACR
ncbi:MAG: hypothetical protein OXR73_25860 [Myxococcales bacterium]|nr:hypothetical protein [Myxococcales bacterium]